MLVTAVLVALYIGIPVDLVSLALTIVSTFISLGGHGRSMESMNDMVVRGAHGAAKSIPWKPKKSKER